MDREGVCGRHALSESLYVLRRELGREIFIAVGGEVALNLDAVGCDVDAFERAVANGFPLDPDTPFLPARAGAGE